MTDHTLTLEVDSPLEGVRRLTTHVALTGIEINRLAVDPRSYGPLLTQLSRVAAYSTGDTPVIQTPQGRLEVTVDSGLRRGTILIETTRDRWTARLEQKV